MCPSRLGSIDVTAQSPDRLPAIDAVRGLAALAVVAQHVSVVNAQTLPATPLRAVFGLGWLGVDAFFVLSGFLVTSGFLHHPQSVQHPAGFYRRRAIRLLPLYALLVALTWLTGALAGAALLGALTTGINWVIVCRATWSAVPLVLSPAWSLAIEIQFYALWPQVIRLVTLRRLGWACGAMLVGSVVLRAWLVHGTALPQPVIYTLTWARLDTLALGGLLAIALHDERFTRLVVRWWRVGMMTGLVGLFLGIAFAHPPYEFDRALLVLASTCMGVLTVSGLVPLLDPAMSSTGSAPSTFWALVVRFWAPIGRWSYGIYLLHLPVLVAVLWGWGPLDGTMLETLQLFAWTAMGAVAMGAATFRWFEVPMTRWLTHHTTTVAAAKAA